jgi:hypothetical protein
MMNLIQEIVKLVAPPDMPVAATGDWKWVEAHLGLVFPRDYKEFLRIYGAGVLCDLFEIVSPFQLIDPPRDFWVNWAGFYKSMEMHGEHIPYPVYPESPGLLPCGSYGTVDVINWHTCGDPDDWPIVYYDRDYGFFQTQQGLVAFLLSALQGQPQLPQSMMSARDFSLPFSFRKI